MRILIIMFYLILIMLGVTFSVLNSKIIDLNLYYLSLNLPISVLMLAALSIGILIGVLSFALRYLRLKLSFARLKSQLAMTEREVKNLRSIPIQDQH
ncbi:MAG: hypothetical protein A3F18_00130 [Legionellales bacterium RIFCSPHIGHO2_12_FULL_37_14]|nr:MAG: hypothetical protein A3F18_00130 [Legionellales bacterium RIFCSPHIGHO2_12_FULL_37_14]